MSLAAVPELTEVLPSEVDRLSSNRPKTRRLRVASQVRSVRWLRVRTLGRYVHRTVSHRWQAVRPYSGTITALSCFVVAAFLVGLVLGFVVAGLAFAGLEWRVKGE
jgi:hypothetical protein